MCTLDKISYKIAQSQLEAKTLKMFYIQGNRKAVFQMCWRNAFLSAVFLISLFSGNCSQEACKWPLKHTLKRLRLDSSNFLCLQYESWVILSKWEEIYHYFILKKEKGKDGHHEWLVNFRRKQINSHFLLSLLHEVQISKVSIFL